MAHGQPDFGMYAIAETIYKLTDMGELAARLGSIVTFDRRGDIVWLDDFEDNIEKWYALLGGAGASVALSTEAARNGGKSAKLATNAAVGGCAGIRRYLQPTVLTKLGFEISFTLTSAIDYLHWWLHTWKDNVAYYAQIKYDNTNKVLSYTDKNYVQQTLADPFYLYTSAYHFHTLKLVKDLANIKYVRLLLDDRVFDLSAYDLYSAPSLAINTSMIEVLAVSALAAGTSIYVDDAIITQNEP